MSEPVRTKKFHMKRTVIRGGKYVTEIKEFSKYFDTVEILEA